MSLLLSLAIAVAAQTGVWTPAEERATSPQYNRCLKEPDAANGVHHAMMRCGDEEMARQDARLNQAYRMTMQRLPRARQAKLRSVQRVWIKQRDRTCAPYAGPDTGQAGELNHSGCLLRETIARRLWLERYR